MAYQKLQPTQAAPVILSDTINPINPSRPYVVQGINDKVINKGIRDLSVATLSYSGNPTSIVANKLIDAAADFSSVVVGDTITNQSGDTTNVTVVDSIRELTLADDIFALITDTYRIYTGGFLGQVSVGDIVVDTTDVAYAIVTDVYSAELAISADIFTGVEGFTIYGNTAQMNSNTEAFVVYVGATSGVAATWAEVKVTTAAGNDVVFSHFPTGTFLPVQCLRVWDTGTTATNLVALW